MAPKYKAKIGNGQILGKWIQGNYIFPLFLKKSERTLLQLYAENAVDTAEKNALNSKDVDFVKLKKMALLMSDAVTSVDQLIPTLQLVLRNLRDKHGFVFSTAKAFVMKLMTLKM
ncbi:hypothetical protein [Dyadobacter sp. 3J3]|uniref:hypothetical protein n=1 Tax=Dyadobacter sp. 3J3 TaxID=2606600 RepID=UPI001358BE75|nr:hypothetical protein [Dyadobacter sp. 3J3]